MPKAKSVQLTDEELKAFQFWVNKNGSKKEAAGKLGFSMPLMSRMYFHGRGSEDTVTKIREVLQQVA